MLCFIWPMVHWLYIWWQEDWPAWPTPACRVTVGFGTRASWLNTKDKKHPGRSSLSLTQLLTTFSNKRQNGNFQVIASFPFPQSVICQHLQLCREWHSDCKDPGCVSTLLVSPLLQKWPMRSRLYIGATGQFLTHSAQGDGANQGETSTASQI